MRPTASRLSLAALVLLAACDVPTAAPRYTTEWNVPAKSTTISVNTFLPSGVSATSDNSAFQATVSPSTTSISRTLGQDCAACSAANGQTIPKPAFTGGGNTSVSIPNGVSSATLVRDTLTITINNGFNFDPIRPSASGVRGYLVVRVTSGSATIGRDSIDGSASALGAGSSTVRKIALSGTVSGANGLQIVTTLNSPLGDPVVINTNQQITVSGGTGPLFISAASVNLSNQSVSASNTDFDLSSIDKTITDHVDSGSLLLTVTNPFAVTGTLNVTLAGGSAPVVKQIALATGTSTPTVALSQAEIKSLFGHTINIGFSGTVSGANITVSPGQTVSVVSRLQLAINTGTN